MCMVFNGTYNCYILVSQVEIFIPSSVRQVLVISQRVGYIHIAIARPTYFHCLELRTELRLIMEHVKSPHYGDASSSHADVAVGRQYRTCSHRAQREKLWKAQIGKLRLWRKTPEQISTNFFNTKQENLKRMGSLHVAHLMIAANRYFGCLVPWSVCFKISVNGQVSLSRELANKNLSLSR